MNTHRNLAAVCLAVLVACAVLAATLALAAQVIVPAFIGAR